KAILVVDDADDARNLVATVLRRSGATVHLAGSVDEALGILDGHATDLVISDIGMPGRSGYDLVRILKRRYPDLPAIALTAHALDADRRVAITLGFQEHFSKPVARIQLLEAVVRLTETKQGRPHDL